MTARMRPILTVLIALSLWAQKPAPEAVARGRKQYEQACGFCHGPDATGARAPDLIRSALVNPDKSGDLLGPLIRSGRPDKGMPPLPLSDAQIADIAVFLHARVTDALRSARVPSDYPEERLLTGNAAAGKAYFNGAGGCAGCHSPAGDLAGIARKFSPINLQARFLYPSGKRPAATVTLSDGAKFEGTLASIDDFDVAIKGADGWYRSWARASVKVEVRYPLTAHRDLLRKYTDADIHNLFAYLETLK
jgi:cytochrome c oxidase cbb3-type subunit 3